jgi:hypothetical protein
MGNWSDVPGENAKAYLHKLRSKQHQDPFLAQQDEQNRKTILRWKNIAFLLVLIVILLPFIFTYLSYLLRQ